MQIYFTGPPERTGAECDKNSTQCVFPARSLDGARGCEDRKCLRDPINANVFSYIRVQPVAIFNICCAVGKFAHLFFPLCTKRFRKGRPLKRRSINLGFGGSRQKIPLRQMKAHRPFAKSTREGATIAAGQPGWRDMLWGGFQQLGYRDWAGKSNILPGSWDISTLLFRGDEILK